METGVEKIYAEKNITCKENHVKFASEKSRLRKTK